MKDIRISIRLNQEEHKALKVMAIQKDTNIQEMIHNIIVKILEENKNEKN